MRIARRCVEGNDFTRSSNSPTLPPVFHTSASLLYHAPTLAALPVWLPGSVVAQPKFKQPKHQRRSRSVRLDGEELKRYLEARGKPPKGGLRRNMRLGLIDRNSFPHVMERHRIPQRDWHRFLPEGGIAGVEPPTRHRDGQHVLVWFPTAGHLTGIGGSPLTWIGAGTNDSVEAVQHADTSGESVPRIPLIERGRTPTLRIRFSHRAGGVDPRNNWWSAVVGFFPGATSPEWRTVDITKFDRIKLFVRGQIHSTTKARTRPPIALRLRFEDDTVIDVNGEAEHSSSSWSRRPIEVAHWLRPNWLSLKDDFEWGPNAFWRKSPAVDQRNILQVTFGMDDQDPGCEGVIEIYRIELHGDSPHVEADIAPRSDR